MYSNAWKWKSLPIMVWACHSVCPSEHLLQLICCDNFWVVSFLFIFDDKNFQPWCLRTLCCASFYFSLFLSLSLSLSFSFSHACFLPFPCCFFSQAILARRFVVEELYDVVHKVAELSITSDSETVRNQSRQVREGCVFVNRGSRLCRILCLFLQYQLTTCKIVCILSVCVCFLLCLRSYRSFCWTILWVKGWTPTSTSSLLT